MGNEKRNYAWKETILMIASTVCFSLFLPSRHVQSFFAIQHDGRQHLSFEN